jgi:thiosulfate dehydrogenase
LTKWFRAPDPDAIPNDFTGREIRYGRELIQRTAYYLGPQGTVGHYLGNHMSCQNCHLDAGTKMFSPTLKSTHANYPQFRARENIIIAVPDRVNLCIQRPHIGRDLPADTREMRAMELYIKWLGRNMPLNSHTYGDDVENIKPIARAADPVQGKLVYEKNCQVCHGANGEGRPTEDGIAYVYPPLWGPESFGMGSTMHRVLKAAAFIKNNMPFGTTWENPVLTDEEAFDVAAYIDDDEHHPRHRFDPAKDFVDIGLKPVDYPYGPYADDFSEQQHHFGPFQPIIDAHKKRAELTAH